MKTVFYKIECLTNLHVGSGDINYNIIDNEVEKDTVSGLPIIHASGVKGALRDAMVGRKCNIGDVFGVSGSGENGNAGSHKFLDAFLLSRPMRVSGSDKTASISVVSVDSVNRFLKKLSSFGVNPYGVTSIDIPEFGKNEFLVASGEKIKVEGEATDKLDEKTVNALKWLAALIGDFAVTKSFDDYALPVVARNCLDENGISKNLWYEEIVPHDSIFYFAVIYPDNADELDFPEVVQFGGNASIGCGYTKISKIG